MKKLSKADIYSKYGIEYKAGKIYNPMFGWINPILVDGNSKLGKGVWTFSSLPGTNMYHIELSTGDPIEVKGTCLCDCPGCYAQTGFYRMSSTIKSLAIKTAIARYMIDWLKNAILAQIEADNIELCRIHASGDFFGTEYIAMWHDVAAQAENTVFWTYTKNAQAEHAFDDLSNINIVHSIIPGIGFNYGHCDYIIKAYKALKKAGNTVYICRCGIDPNQHCNKCAGCSKHDFVLFVEHSTAYKAENDPMYNELVKLVESQAFDSEYMPF